jgi:hypothetical protein
VQKKPGFWQIGDKKPGFFWWSSRKTQLEYRRNPVSGRLQETGFLLVEPPENSA